MCVDGDIRLVNSPAGRNSSGRLEICVNEDWSTVCDMGWGTVDANVACRQLGFSRYGENAESWPHHNSSHWNLYKGHNRMSHLPFREIYKIRALSPLWRIPL